MRSWGRVLAKALDRGAAVTYQEGMCAPEGHPVLAAVLDLAMLPMARLRPDIVTAATGRVLELGVGTGLNLPLYAGIAGLWGVEPDPHMLRRARARAATLPFPVELLPTGAEALPFPDAHFDTVVATFVFCTIGDPAAAAAEALRVLRPGGAVLFAEHVRSGHPAVHAIQRGLEPAWSRLAGGCHLTRDPVGLLRAAGATGIDVRARGSAWSLLPIVTGRARKA